MSSIRSVASSIPCNRAIRSSDHAEVTSTPRASRIRRLSSRIRMIRSFALSKSCLHGSTKGKSTLQAHPGFLSLHRSRSFSMQLFLAGPSGNLCRSSHKPMPVITAGRTRSNIRWPFVVVVAVVAHPLAFSRGIAQEGHAHPGGRTRLQPIYHMAAALYVTQSRAPKKAPRRIEALFTNCVGSFLDYFPFLAAAFLSAFFIFFAIMISFSHLLLKTVLVGLRQTCNPIPCSSSTDEQRHCQEKS